MGYDQPVADRREAVLASDPNAGLTLSEKAVLGKDAVDRESQWNSVQACFVADRTKGSACDLD